jgi:mono/diheme cytochrome c family protein
MKRFHRIALAVLLAAAFVGFVLQMGCEDAQNILFEAIGGEKYTRAQIERGEYLVENVSMCGGCHTPFGPTGFDLTRRLAGGNEFIPDALWTANITPDPETGIGRYTDEQLFKAITQGVGHYRKNPNGEPLFAIMPYYVFANMTPDDVYAIIAYLRKGVNPIRNEVPERAPFIVPPRPARPLDYSSLPGADDDPGKYLTSAAGLCIECHTQRVESAGPPDPAALDPEKYFAGGEEFDIPGFSVRSANITPDPETGIGEWTREQIVTALVEGENEEGLPLCPPMEQFDGLTESDLNAVVNFIRNLPPINNFVEECELVEGPPPGP